MTHTDDLLDTVMATMLEAGREYGDFIDRSSDFTLVDRANDIIAAVHADIAARALSEEVVEAVRIAMSRRIGVGASGWEAEDVVETLLLALGITESEAE